MKEFYFDDVDILINHLLYKYKELPPLKLQKNLYFLFAFYSGTYQVEEKEGNSEFSYLYPRYLFNADFEAWTYGPVIREVYNKNKNNGYSAKKFEFDMNSTKDKEISNFIDDVSDMIMNKSDFALVDRSHGDQVWKNAIAQGNSTPMKKEDIENEYKEIFQNIY